MDAILDFRDADELRHASGAEDPDYAAADLDHDAKDAPFQIVEELQQVYGMTREVYDQIAPALTVYSQRPVPDLNTAPPLVLEAVPDPRTQPDDSETDTLQDLSELSPDDITETPTALTEVGRNARSGVPVFTIHAEGRAQSGAVFALEAVVNLQSDGGAPYEFLAWRRARRELFDDGRQGEDEGE